MQKLSSIEWIERANKKALELKHKVLNIELTQKGVINGESIIYLNCLKCNTDFELSSIGNYVRNVTTGCPECLNSNQAVTMTFPIPEEVKQKGTLTRRLNYQKKLEEILERAKTDPNFSLSPLTEDGVSREWKNAIFLAYAKRCFCTSLEHSTEDRLEIHHLYSRHDHPDKKNILNNGVLLKQSVHIKFHQEYGQTYNTPEQFEDFCRKHYNITNFPWRDAGFYNQTETIFFTCFVNAKYNGELFNKLVKERGHEIIEFHTPSKVYVNMESKVTIGCLKCDQKPRETKTVELYKNSKHGLYCCTTKAAKEASSTPRVAQTFLNKEVRASFWQDLLQLMNSREHEFLCFVDTYMYHNRDTQFRVICHKCDSNKIITITVKNYKRNICGLPCCNKNTATLKRTETLKRHRKVIKELMTQDQIFKKHKNEEQNDNSI